MMTIRAQEYLKRYSFSVEDFEQMIAAGVFDDDDRVELIDGEFIEMTPPNPPHDGCINRLNHAFTSRCGDRCIVSVQN